MTLGILAGGQATRLGGADKAFEELHGEALLTRTRVAWGDGFGATLVSYNGVLARIEAAGFQGVPDIRPGYRGPLAGIESMLRVCPRPWLLTTPVDLRDTPVNVFERLAACQAVARTGSGVVVCDADGLQPLVALWPTACSERVSQALDAGHDAVHELLRGLGFARCDISPARLGNLNSPADFE